MSTKKHDLYENPPIPKALLPFIVELPWPAPWTISVTEVVKKTKLSRRQVYAMIKKNDILAWKGPDGRYGVPEAQFMESGNPVPGLREVLEVIGNVECAWDFLTQNWPLDRTYEWPLECLRRGGVEDVVGAAMSYGWAYT